MIATTPSDAMRLLRQIRQAKPGETHGLLDELESAIRIAEAEATRLRAELHSTREILARVEGRDSL